MNCVARQVPRKRPYEPTGPLRLERGCSRIGSASHLEAIATTEMMNAPNGLASTHAAAFATFVILTIPDPVTGVFSNHHSRWIRFRYPDSIRRALPRD